MTTTEEYIGIVKGQLEDIEENESENILKAAHLMKDTLINDGLIYVFGSGHSQIFSIEMFYRAGGLVPVNPMLEASVAMNTGTMTSEYERVTGIGTKIFEKSGMKEGDTLIVVSHSGRNPMPIELARAASKAGIKVITIVSSEFMKGVSSREASGKFVKDYAEIVIDNHCIYGDAVLEFDGLDMKAVGTSSILSITILESMVANTIELCLEEGYTPPIWVSGNVDDGDKKNNENYLKFRSRIPFL